jgi:hypothetical protein
MVKHNARFANGKDRGHSRKDRQARLNRSASVHPQIACAQLPDCAAIASEKMWN